MAKKIQLHGEFTSAPVTHSWDGTVLTITSSSGTSSANLQGPQGLAGLVWRGEWRNDLTYSYGDVVQYNGSAYIVGGKDATIPSGVSPIDDPHNWHLLAAAASGGGSDSAVINF